MIEQTHCTLCHFPLYGGGRQYAEGKFCDDAAGCRRRALAHLLELQSLVIEVIGGIEQVKRIAELPDLPAKMRPDILRNLARKLLIEKEDNDGAS